jgi:hypothetical protein
MQADSARSAWPAYSRLALVLQPTYWEIEMGRRTLLTTVLLLSTIIAIGAFMASAFAQKTPATSVSQPQDNLAVANEHVKDLLLLMDADQNGKVSRQEWMSFMEAEFNRLDKDGKGELDVKELLASRLSVMHVHSTDSAK